MIIYYFLIYQDLRVPSASRHEALPDEAGDYLQEIMMDHALRTISYIADIGDLLVVMARRGPVATSPASSASTPAAVNQTKICCHIFESDEVRTVCISLSFSPGDVLNSLSHGHCCRIYFQKMDRTVFTQ